MPFPLILLGLGALAVTGTGAGIAGAVNLSEAKDIGNKAEARLRRNQRWLESQRIETERAAQAYGQLLLSVQTDTIQQFIDFLEAIENRAERDAYLRLLHSIDITPPKIQKFKVDVIQARDFAEAILQAGGAGLATSAGTMSLVGLLGTASTGTAIASLSGAAANSATLAWLGGGSLAAGGAGVAGGALVAGGLLVAPALFVGGFWLASKGSQALTEAKQYEARVDIAVANMDSTVANLLRPLRTRIQELQSLVIQLNQRAKSALMALNPRTFSVRSSACVTQFQTVGLLVKALADIAKTPILDEHGNITYASHNIYLKYKQVVL